MQKYAKFCNSPIAAPAHALAPHQSQSEEGHEGSELFLSTRDLQSPSVRHGEQDIPWAPLHTAGALVQRDAAQRQTTTEWKIPAVPSRPLDELEQASKEQFSRQSKLCLEESTYSIL